MANAQFHKLPQGDYINLGAPGAPAYFKVVKNPTDGNWYPSFTWNGDAWFDFVPATPATTQAQAQTQLDNFITAFLAGTIGP